ncbi:rhodanese-like domain-containing protein [Aquabacterium sp. J223]|uniref:rhodanese-like domain-containing protein n=1 Tax=Aquabacterium sp. J223 TaxID=2898431 RepID=UPI0021ADD851|nr:rhodanese-like domain-containing protein [Aquabacterium sp. J223]UUX97948.1 rhodanese-like domain-containing protein [Aquabacterium sp. J223]
MSGGLLAWPALARLQGAGGVSPQQAVMMINREKAVLIDISEPAEYAAGHPLGARNIPLAQLAAGAKGLPTNKAQPVVVVCATGGRASRGAAALKALGHEKVHSLAGGLQAWREANLPVEKLTPKGA